MSRSTNKLFKPLQVAVFGAPGTRKEQFSALLIRNVKSSGMAAEIAMPTTINAAGAADMIFLMGLQSNPAENVSADKVLRQLLACHQLPYQVLYGAHEECLVQAMDIIRRHIHGADIPKTLKTQPQAKSTISFAAQWVWACDKCSDPQCEHNLLTSLLANR